MQAEITNTLNPAVTDAQEALDAATKDYDKAVEKLQGAIAKAQTAYDDWKSASDILAGEVRDARVKLLANGLSNADLNSLVKKAQDIVAKDAKVASVTVYRLYNAGLKQHLYTTDANEYEVLAERGWTQEGTAFKSATEGTPVYRLYNASLKVHLYTTDANEYTTLAKKGWTQEGIAFYSAKESEGTPVYRLYNAGLKKHLYTTDSNEYKVLAQRGWTQEGVAFYSAK